MSRAKVGVNKYVMIELSPSATDAGTIRLIEGGRNAYLWFSGESGSSVGTASGASALRALARAILKEVPPPKKRALLK